jgi:serine protease AprX
MGRRRWVGTIVLVALAIAGGTMAGLARGSTDWTAKVDASVLDAAAAGQTQMLVYLERRADLSGAAALATKAEKGRYVYEQLRAVASQSQAPVIAELEQRGATHRSFWITNALIVNGDLSLVETLAQRADVQHIYGIGSGQLELPPVEAPGGTDSHGGGDATIFHSISLVNANDVWALGYRGQGAVVASADTGVHWTHEAIKSKYRGWDGTTANHDYNWHDAIHNPDPTVACDAPSVPPSNPAPCDDNSHGTHTVGTMVGTAVPRASNGNVTHIGMAPDAKWIACRNMTHGFGVVPTYLECMEWLIAPTKIDGSGPDPTKAPDVVNNSWGCVEVCPPPALQDTLRASRAAGIFYSVSAGNDGDAEPLTNITVLLCSSLQFPLGRYPEAFTVGSTTWTTDTASSFSSRGPVLADPGQPVMLKPNIAAPGSTVMSASTVTTAMGGANDTYGNKSGTSMASPHVGGLVALIISANPALRGQVDQIEQIIERTAVPKTAPLEHCGGLDAGLQRPNNTYGWGRIDALAAVQAALHWTPAPSASTERLGLPAQTVDIAPPVSEQTHPTVDYGDPSTSRDDREGTTRWRVVKNTGNCCENHLTTTPGGRLFDIGGSFVNYSDDRGLTWKSVRPLTPLVNGEGSIAVAPNGDVVAIEWDPYSGDHLLAFKYNAALGKWFYMENPLHHPFYDRPWISVVPGPFQIGGQSVPYVTFVQGGFPIKDPMFTSSDGLSYLEPSSLTVDGATDTPVSDWFPIAADASFDWIQPIKRSPVIGLGAGRALAAGGWMLDPSDRKWDSWRLPDGSTPPFFIQIDSGGRIHHVRSAEGGKLEYRISSDGGRSWTSTIAPVALGGLADFKVNRAAGIGAVATRVGNQDWVYKFDVTGDTAQLLRRYRLGLGDTQSVVGVTTNLQAPRMDFQTIAIFADGRIAASFLDSTTLSTPPGTGMLGRITPVVAVELETELPPLRPDVTPGPLSVATQRVQGGDELTFQTTVRNVGAADAAGVAVRFLVDGVQVGSEQTLSGLAPDESATVTSAAWSAKHQSGSHTVEVQVDPANTVVESNEANNTATATFEVKGNKLANGSFESSANGSAPDNWSSSGATSYESGGFDGERSVTAALGGSWTSDPVPVEPGRSYEASVQVSGAAGMLVVQQLAADGGVLSASTQQLLPTQAFGIAGLTVTAVEGAAQLRVVLIGGATGATRFDDAQLLER